MFKEENSVVFINIVVYTVKGSLKGFDVLYAELEVGWVFILHKQVDWLHPFQWAEMLYLLLDSRDLVELYRFS